MMLRGASSREVAAAVKNELAEIQKSLPDGVKIEAYYDRTELVRRTIHTVTTNLLEASALVILVLLATLASLRAGSVVAVAIPLALLGVFIGMLLAKRLGDWLSNERRSAHFIGWSLLAHGVIFAAGGLMPSLWALAARDHQPRCCWRAMAIASCWSIRPRSPATYSMATICASPQSFA